MGRRLEPHVGSPRPDRGATWIRAPLDRFARIDGLTAREGGANTGENMSGLLIGLWLARATSHAYTAASVPVTPLIIYGDLMVPANGFRDSANHFLDATLCSDLCANFERMRESVTLRGGVAEHAFILSFVAYIGFSPEREELGTRAEPGLARDRPADRHQGGG